MVQPDGDIILLQSLDYETQQQYQIIVMAMVCYNMYIILIIRCINTGTNTNVNNVHILIMYAMFCYVRIYVCYWFLYSVILVTQCTSY